MRLEKWALIRRETNQDIGGLILPQDYTKVRSHGLGDSYERPQMEDGSTITTSRVVELTEDKLVTRSGSEYKLGEMHPDYVSFIAAYEKGIPILKNWQFYNGGLHGNIFKDSNYENEEFLGEGSVFGKVIHQDIENNLCTLRTSKGELIVYVDWHAISKEMLMGFALFFNSEQLSSLISYANKRIKLDILGAHKTMLEGF